MEKSEHKKQRYIKPVQAYLIHLLIIRLHLKQGIQYKLKIGGIPG